MIKESHLEFYVEISPGWASWDETRTWQDVVSDLIGPSYWNLINKSEFSSNTSKLKCCSNLAVKNLTIQTTSGLRIVLLKSINIVSAT